MNHKFTCLLLVGLISLFGCSSTKQSQPIATTPIQPKEDIQQPNTPRNNVVTNPLNSIPKIDHIVVVIEENHSHQEIIGNSSAPFINSMAKQGANFTDYHAIEHPSQPNYLDIFSGSNQGVTNDAVPSNTFSSANLAQELIERQLTFGGYSEDLPYVGFNGATNSQGTYARKHNPWVNFTNLPKEVNMPLSSFPQDYGQLPTISFVIPNLKHDMHDGTIKEGDQWLYDHLDEYTQWAKEHNSLLIVTWDEDDGSQLNQIPTLFVGPMVRTGEFQQYLNHFNLLRTLEDAYNLKHAGKSETSSPIVDIWK